MTNDLAILLLAAGQSRRMGENKLLMNVGGEPLIQRTLRKLLQAEAAPITVVTGYQADRIESEIAAASVRIHRNEDFASGLLSSLRAGLSSLDPEVKAVMVVLSDLVYLDPLAVRALAKAFEASSGNDLLVPLYGEQRGHPVVIPREFFPEIHASESDPEKGAQFLFQHYPERIRFVQRPPCEDAVLDLDTPDDYRNLDPSRLA